MSLLLLASIAFAQLPPPAGSLQGIAGPPPAIHVVVDEAVHPDVLRGFARKGITLWLQTRSNTLAASVVENVARFDSALIQLRPPLKDADARVFARLPKAGLWARPDEALALKGKLPGARKVAIELSGMLSDSVLATVKTVRPWLTRWQVPADADVLMWGQFAQLDGLKVARVADALTPEACERLKVQSVAVEAPGTTCLTGGWLLVDPSAEFKAVQQVTLKNPTVQLVFLVGADSDRARKARELISQLTDAPLR